MRSSKHKKRRASMPHPGKRERATLPHHPHPAATARLNP
jgi:hypothetical protein